MERDRADETTPPPIGSDPGLKPPAMHGESGAPGRGTAVGARSSAHSGRRPPSAPRAVAMTDQVPDFFDPETFADLSGREIVTSSRFDASESARAEDLRMAQLDELDFGAASETDAHGRPPSVRPGRRHALAALVAGLAVAGALIVHTVATSPVVQSARRPLVVTGQTRMTEREPGRVAPPRSHLATVSRSRRDTSTARHRSLVVDPTRRAGLAASVGGDPGAQAQSASGEEFGFER